LPKWHIFILSRREIEPPAAGYWVRGLSGTCWRMELAFDERQPSWRDWAREQLRVGHDVEWVAYRDPKAGRFRYAAVRDGRLEGCVFIAPDHRLVSRSWLTGLFAERALSPNARMSLLTGQPLDAGQDVGAIVCSCFGVGQHQISAEIRQGASSVEDIGRRLRAGTNCGACKPEIGKLLRGAAVRDPHPA
jgi:assimilatory nitrate reductase catalytic subunit